MYNGIGLKTTRGSGTNGYVQRNLSNLKPRDDFRKKNQTTDFKDDRARHVQPDAGILEHERKRKVEIKCMELRDQLEDQEVPEDEIEDKVAALRKSLLEAGAAFSAPSRSETKSLRPSDVHALRAAKNIEEEKMQRALGIHADYKEGDAFDRELQERKKQERIEQRKADWERKQALYKDRSRRDEDDRPRDSGYRRRDDDRSRRREDSPPPRRRDDSPLPTKRSRRSPSYSRSPSPPPRRRARSPSYSRSPSPPARSRRRSPSSSRSPSPAPHSRRRSSTPPAKRRGRSLTPSDYSSRSRSVTPADKGKSRRRRSPSHSRSPSPPRRGRSPSVSRSPSPPPRRAPPGPPPPRPAALDL